jgi:hypothetical protein
LTDWLDWRRCNISQNVKVCGICLGTFNSKGALYFHSVVNVSMEMHDIWLNIMECLKALHVQPEICSRFTAEVRAFILVALRCAEQSCCEGSCQGSEFGFILDHTPPSTINQSCPPHCYKIWEAHGEAVRSSIWPLHASRGSAIVSQPPYRASDHIFGASLNCFLKCEWGTRICIWCSSRMVYFVTVWKHFNNVI